MKIKTDFWLKPIPDRRFDWSAWDDSLGEDASKIGHGPTEEAAIKDLMRQVDDDDYRDDADPVAWDRDFEEEDGNAE